ncbi:hypothetical protein BV372_10475 [Nostoc sp. T09]|nr:hypothetical protein BV372_10475 [Nostoc sp. T09]
MKQEQTHKFQLSSYILQFLVRITVKNPASSVNLVNLKYHPLSSFIDIGVLQGVAMLAAYRLGAEENR